MRKEKELLLNEVKDQIVTDPSFVVMRYTGLKANAANNFRRGLGHIGSHLEMVKKTLLEKAASNLGVSLGNTSLEGHIGIVFAQQDAIEVTKYILKFSQENEKSIEVVGGRVDGKIYSAEEMKVLSTLPGKDEMRAQLLGLFEAPMSHTLGTMDALILSVVYCLDNKVKDSAEGQEESQEQASNE